MSPLAYRREEKVLCHASPFLSQTKTQNIVSFAFVNVPIPMRFHLNLNSKRLFIGKRLSVFEK